MSIALSALLALSSATAPVATADSPEDARRMLADLVAFQTVAGHRDVPAMADYLAQAFREAGFSAEDVQVQRDDATAWLTVRYRGREGSDLQPVLFLAHMDVVPATAAEWKTDPWTLTERDGKLFGRGVVDNKYGLLTIARAFLRLRREGHVPGRDLYLVFTGDEETGGVVTTRQAAERFKGAAFAVNADAGGGFRPKVGPPLYYLQTSEKTYVTFEVTARNEGGHSSRPRPDNAIYELAAALGHIAAHRFPVRWNEEVLVDLAALARTSEGEVAQAAARFVANPGDPTAAATLQRHRLDTDLRTTCVATRLQAGDADNSLPTRATATVNCRAFPGETIAQVQAALQSAIGNPAIEIKTTGTPVDSPVMAAPTAALEALHRVLAVRIPGVQVVPYMESAATDGVHFRRAGIPTVGAGPLVGAEEDDSLRLHGVDENLPIDKFVAGLDHYYRYIKALEPAIRPAPPAAR